MANKIDVDDADELAAAVLGLSDEDAENADIIERKMFERFDVDVAGFVKIAEALLEFVPSQQAALSGRWFKGYAKDGMFIAKIAVAAPVV